MTTLFRHPKALDRDNLRKAATLAYEAPDETRWRPRPRPKQVFLGRWFDRIVILTTLVFALMWWLT